MPSSASIVTAFFQGRNKHGILVVSIRLCELLVAWWTKAKLPRGMQEASHTLASRYLGSELQLPDQAAYLTILMHARMHSLCLSTPGILCPALFLRKAFGKEAEELDYSRRVGMGRRNDWSNVLESKCLEFIVNDVTQKGKKSTEVSKVSQV